MGVHTIDYSNRGITNRIDVPLRIFTEGYYTELLALYKHIGVKVVATDHAGVFADGNNQVIMHYGNGNFAGQDYSYLRRDSIFSPTAWKIALQSRRFFARAKSDALSLNDFVKLTFGEYLQKTNAGTELVETILLPMMSVTCTCNYQTVLSYPADIMLGYLTSGLQKLGILSAAKGVDDIVPRLLEGSRLKTNSAVIDISGKGDRLSIAIENGEIEEYDHVVIAAQSQQAAKMLSGFDEQKRLLNNVSFETSTMSVHTDKNFLPENHRDTISPVSYYIPENSNRAEVTVNLTRTIPRLSSQDTVFQTWNPIREVDPTMELARVQFTRPIVHQESRRAMGSLRDYHHQQGNRLWFCGSYVADKIPLLDAAVDTSVAVAEKLGATIPWKND